MKGRNVTYHCDRKEVKGFLPKYQMVETQLGLANMVGHPKHIAVLDKPDGKLIACVSPSASFYSDLKKHVSFKEAP